MPEIGWVSLGELATVRGGLGLPIERDLSFRAEKRLSAYARDDAPGWAGSSFDPALERRKAPLPFQRQEINAMSSHHDTSSTVHCLQHDAFLCRHYGERTFAMQVTARGDLTRTMRRLAPGAPRYRRMRSAFG